MRFILKVVVFDIWIEKKIKEIINMVGKKTKSFKKEIYSQSFQSLIYMYTTLGSMHIYLKKVALLFC